MSERIACLPMYDLPEMRDAHDAFWRAIAGRLPHAPAALTRGNDLQALWRDPRLLLGQTCGYPLMRGLAGKVQLVATPCYTAEGCTGPLGRSAIVVRRTDRVTILADLHRRVCAINTPDSNSGMNLLRAAIAPLAGSGRFFQRVILTGAHAESARAVAEGAADLAAIDCVTWALLARHRPALVHPLRVLDWTPPSPWLPLITSLATTPPELAALRAALRPDQALLIEGYAECGYAPILALEQAAVEAGYPEVK